MLSAIVRRRPITTTSLALLTGASAYLGWSNDESVRGIRRQAHFWSSVGPVVADYYWNLSQTSPYVKYLKWKDATVEVENRKLRMQQLHERHSDSIYNVMVDLKGLYIKLGQVLSVTALPVPEVYRDRFRTLQSNVEGWEHFDTVIRPLLEEELGAPLEELFLNVDPIPCGAASIGQAHRATTLLPDQKEIILKIQYPDASWQVPADIASVGRLLQICVLAGVVDESAAKLSFEDFSRQFLAELDYGAERRNLQEIHESSLKEKSPYRKHSVVVPSVLQEYCGPHILAMTYLKGPKLEEEAHRQLKRIGIDTKRNVRALVKSEENGGGNEISKSPIAFASNTNSDGGASPSRLVRTVRWLGTSIGFDTLLATFRWANRVSLYSRGILAKGISWMPFFAPESWKAWALQESTSIAQANQLALSSSWVDALLDVHGYQIFAEGLFNGDCHPGNILVDGTQLGLIDFGQCKRLNLEERQRVAKLIVAVADKNATDLQVATAFRNLGVKTREDSTEFLANFARLMFGAFQPEHLDHAWHKSMHKMDHIDYFPTELSMIYRTALLLRGLAMSLQTNPSIADHWLEHATSILKEERMEKQVAISTVVD